LWHSTPCLPRYLSSPALRLVPHSFEHRAHNRLIRPRRITLVRKPAHYSVLAPLLRGLGCNSTAAGRSGAWLRSASPSRSRSCHSRGLEPRGQPYTSECGASKCAQEPFHFPLSPLHSLKLFRYPIIEDHSTIPRWTHIAEKFGIRSNQELAVLLLNNPLAGPGYPRESLGR